MAKQPVFFASSLLVLFCCWPLPCQGSGPVAYATVPPTGATSISLTSTSTITGSRHQPTSSGGHNKNVVVSIFDSVTSAVSRTVNGAQEMWANYGTCKDIRAKIKQHEDALAAEWVRQGLYDSPNAKACKDRLRNSIPGGITFAEYAFLQQGKEDRGKLMNLAFFAVGAPRFLPYAFFFQPEMMPSPLKPPFDGGVAGETLWQRQSRERSTIILETLLQLEKQAHSMPGFFAQLNIFGRRQQMERIQGQLAWNAQVHNFLETTGTVTRQGAQELLSHLEPWLYKSSGNGGGFDRAQQRLSQVPLAITKGLGDALFGGGFFANLSPAFMQRGRLVGHLKKVEGTDQFLVQADVDLTTIPPALLRQTCSDRLIGNAGMSTDDLQASLGDWLDLVQRKPMERQAATSEYYNGNVARTALLGYYAMQGTQDKGTSCSLPRILYRGPVTGEEANEDVDANDSSARNSRSRRK